MATEQAAQEEPETLALAMATGVIEQSTVAMGEEGSFLRVLCCCSGRHGSLPPSLYFSSLVKLLLTIGTYLDKLKDRKQQ